MMLAHRRLLADEALARARLVSRESGDRLESVVTRLGMMSEQALADEMGRATGLEVV